LTLALEDAVWPALAERSEAILLVPVGATEQHGPHLPLGTDTRIAVALARSAAASTTAAECLVAPAIPYGSSGEHAGFPGTLSIGQEATEQLLIELCRSASASFRRVMLVCAHGGNAGPLQAAVATLQRERRDVRAFVPAWGGDAHAGRTETSLMLALAPEYVQPSDAQPGETRPLAAIIGELRSVGIKQVSPNGILGDPTGASAERGNELLQTAAQQLADELGGWR
jgi:creatinine amidohydrolase